MECARIVPRNGIRRIPAAQPAVIISGTVASADMKEVIQGGPVRTYKFPPTVASVYSFAFSGRQSLTSVRLNDSLEVLGYWCFGGSGIRGIVLPANVNNICVCAFYECRRLQYADLSAAHGLECIPKSVFNLCDQLERITLNEGLRTIGEFCFKGTGLRGIEIPRSAKCIDNCAF